MSKKSPFSTTAIIFATLAVTFASATGSLTGQDTLSQRYKKIDSVPGRYRNKVIALEIEKHWLGDRWLLCGVPTSQTDTDFFLVDLNEGEKIQIGSSAELIDEVRDYFRAKGKDKQADRIKSIQLDHFEIEENSQAPALTFFSADRFWNWSTKTMSLKLAKERKGSSQIERITTTKRRSRGSQQQRGISFVNETKFELKFEWLDYSGQAVDYGSVKPKKSISQNTFDGHVWKITPTNSSLKPLYIEARRGTTLVSLFDYSFEKSPAPASTPAKVPATESSANNRKKELSARIASNNLRILDGDRKTIFKTKDGTEKRFYAGPLRWSPDRKWLIALSTIPGDRRKVTLVDAAPKSQLQPKTIELNYAKPGDRLRRSMPVLIDLRNPAKVSMHRIDSEKLPYQWSLNQFRWAPDSKSFTFLYNKRGHQELTLFRCDVESKKPRTIIKETSKTFIHYSGKQFIDFLDRSNEIIWMSERDGWCHLYLFDSITGKLKNQITSGEWVVRKVVRVDAESRQIWFAAGGVDRSEDPYHQHLCRIDFDGNRFVDLTPSDGDHQWDFSPDRKFFIDSWSRVDLPPVHALRSTETGEIIYELAAADASLLIDAGWKMPERFIAKGRDGKTDIHGFIIRPSHFDKTKKYPIIESIYAGPHSAHVPKRFSTHSGLSRLAELGFIVVKIDGMGTSHRSKAFHDVCWKNLADAGFPDRKKWITAAAKANPEMDLNRVGIYGGSAGGQNAMGALLFHNDFYHAAAADCGCHDNRMDKIWWNEQWMGYPIDEHYEDQSNVTNAHRLKGKLLLTVGAMDRNVDPSSTMQVVDALIKADKEFDLMVFPGGGHGVGSGRYGRHRMYRFFEDCFLEN
jgi:dipeptidyl aminopeptidase/acylaminoacyl peptidase